MEIITIKYTDGDVTRILIGEVISNSKGYMTIRNILLEKEILKEKIIEVL